jgi:PAS domain S-box-containing protein
MNSIAGPASRTDRLGRARIAELILESAADFAIVTTDLDGTITGWNAAAERTMGWPEAEAVGQHASMLFTPEDRAQDVCGREMAEARAEGRAADERWHARKDGSRFWASGATTPLRCEHTGEHLGFLKILRDRTAEHRSGERLRASEALLRSVMENSADCLKLLTPDGRVSHMNAPGLRAMEIADPEAVLGKDWASLWPEAERAKLGAALAEARAGRVGRFQGLCPTAKGAPKWWDVQVTSVPGSGGEPELLLASSRDVTEQRRAEEELRLLNGRLEAEAARRAEECAGKMRRCGKARSWRPWGGSPAAWRTTSTTCSPSSAPPPTCCGGPACRRSAGRATPRRSRRPPTGRPSSRRSCWPSRGASRWRPSPSRRGSGCGTSSRCSRPWWGRGSRWRPRPGAASATSGPT